MTPINNNLVFKTMLLLSILAVLNIQQLIAGGRILSLGNAGITSEGIFSSDYNQAGLAFLTKPSVAIFTQRKFGINELNDHYLAVAFPLNKNTWGLSFGYSGLKTYNVQKTGITYARKLSPGATIGIRLNYLTSHIPESGSLREFNEEIGFQYLASEHITLGVHFYNPHSHFSDYQATYDPPKAGAGITWKVKDNFLLISEISKAMQFPVNYKLGLELKHKELFFLRTGLQTFPFTHTLGAGIYYKGCNIDFAAAHHQVLGFSPAISLNYEFR